MQIRIPVAGLLALTCAAALALSEVEGRAQEPPQTPQEPPPVTFRVEVNYVEVDAIVTDANGNPITDLTQKDFQILEDGRPQTISTFSMVNLPVERAERPLFADAPIEPDVQTNTAAEGRIYLIVLDDLHVTFSNTPRVRRALAEFVNRNFGVNDLAAVVFTSGRGQDGQDFTNNRRLLLSAVDKFLGRKLRSEVLEMADQIGRPRADDSRSLLDPLERERAQNARTTMDQVEKLAEFMAGVRGRRKALILVSEGISYNIYDVLTNTSANMVMQETSDAIGAATRGNVAIYSIDPRGLDAFAEGIEIASAGDDPNTFSPVRAFQDTLRLSQESLRVLSAETGGFAAVNRNDFADAFARLVRENSTYYVLGFYPANERRDGRFRRIDVRVTRPGAQVRSRRGYVAPRGRAPEPARSAGAAVAPVATALNEALASPIALNGIPMSVFAAPYKGTAPNAAIPLVIEMAGRDFRFAEKDGTFNDRIEISFTAVDTRGTARGGDRHTLTTSMKPDTVERVRELGFRVVSQIDLPPGRYQLRIAVAEEGATRSGSVLYDLEVPDFYKLPFSMSGVTLTSGRSTITPTVLPKAPLRDVLPAPPVAQREFERGDVLALFTEFYETATNLPPHALDFTTTVRAGDGRTVFEDREERSSSDLQGSAGGHGYRVNIPLEGLAPGAYVIRVEGRSRANTEVAAGKEVVIRVR
jgi:VWFA-related protein